MSKRLLFVLLIMTASRVACGQITFISHLDSIQAGKNAQAYGLELTPTGYLVTGLQFSHDAYGELHVFIRTLDSLGNFVSEREFWYGQNKIYNQGSFDPIDQDGNSYVGPLVQYDSNLPWEVSLRFVKMDAQGDTLFSKVIAEHTDADSVSINIYQVRTMSSGGYAMGGFLYNNGPKTQGWVLRLDDNGDTLWTKVIGPATNTVTIHGVEENYDHGLLLSGSRLQGFSQNDNFLIRLDSLGNELWRRQYGADVGGGGRVARLAPDSTIVTWSGYREIAWSPSIYHVMNLRKWDQDGNLIWSRLGEFFTDLQFANDLEILPGGSIVCAMNHTGVAGLWKFSAAGDSLWLRRYWVFNSPGGGYTTINDVLLTPDGGFAFCGYSEQGSTDPTPDLKTWYVIKTDSLGCVIPGCHLVGVQEYEITLQEHLHIGPNPATDHINLTLDIPPNYPLTGQLQAVLLDAQGRTVRTQALVHTGTQVRGTLAVGDLPRGLYLLHVTDAKMWLAGSKVVLE